MWSHIRTFAVVTFVTVLIWVFAESETLQPADRQAQVTFVAAASSQIYEILRSDGTVNPEATIRATIDLRGSPPSIARFDEALRRGPIEISPQMLRFNETGTANEDLVSLIQKFADQNRLGVTIERVDPPTLTVRSDEMVSRTMRVVPGVAGGETDGLPQSLPPEVTLVLPKLLANELTSDDVALAKIDPTTWGKLVPGKRETVTGVRIELPAAIAGRTRVRVSPAVVDVALTVKSKLASVQLNSVPVALRISPEEFNKWRIDVPEQDRFLTDVTITGPAEFISQVSTQVVQVVAVVPLTFEELEKKITSKEAVFVDLPPGTKVEVANRIVRLQVTARTPDRAPLSSPPQ